MHEYVYEWIYEYMHETCVTCMTVYNRWNWQNWTSKMGGGLTSQYKHSTIFFGDNITGDESHTVGVNPFKQTTDGVKPFKQTNDGVKPIFKLLMG